MTTCFDARLRCFRLPFSCFSSHFGSCASVSVSAFVAAQVESEAKISTIIAKVSDENKTPGLLRQLDHELGLEAGQA